MSIEEMTEKEFRTVVADRLRTEMKQNNISQKELSDMTGISQSMIHRYLSGRSDISVFKFLKLFSAIENADDPI